MLRLARPKVRGLTTVVATWVIVASGLWFPRWAVIATIVAGFVLALSLAWAAFKVVTEDEL